MKFEIPDPKDCQCQCCQNARLLKNTRYALANSCECFETSEEDWCHCSFCEKARALMLLEE